MKNISSTWEFVEKYYPKYQSCNEIAENDDLTKIIEGEINGQAEVIYNEIKEDLKENIGITPEEFQIIEVVQQRLNESNAYIFEKAIEGYIESLKSKLPVYWSTADFEATAEKMFNDLKEDNPSEFAHLETWEQLYDKSKFQEQLEKMINSHDASIGITWETVAEYVGQCEIRN